MHEERKKMIQKPPKSSKPNKADRREVLKPRQENIAVRNWVDHVSEDVNYETEMARYFSVEPTLDVTTCLFIPLAPTPTSRVPLAPFPSHHPSLIPLQELSRLHSSYTTHSHHVAALFARLDDANVWSRGVICKPYTQGFATNDGEGICTFLMLEFKGWTKAEVRGVIGESGTGWCAMEERRGDKESTDDELLSNYSEMLSEPESVPIRIDDPVDEGMDPAQSFVLPTLDFSSSFVAASSPPRYTPPSVTNPLSPDQGNAVLDSVSDTDTDLGSDLGSDFSSASALSESLIAAPSVSSEASSWIGFSADFASRAVSVEHEPRENPF
jgi:hypothetical protein